MSGDMDAFLKIPDWHHSNQQKQSNFTKKRNFCFIFVFIKKNMSHQTTRTPLSRIPGGMVSMPLAKQENHVKDLSKLTNLELLDTKYRESKLLANKAKLQRLPDKGKRIQVFYDKVEAELQKRSNVNEAAELFSSLNIASKGQDTLNALEWRGHLNGKEGTEIDASEDVLDSDDETEMDPLRLIAQRTMHERKIIILPTEPQLITAEDLQEIQSFQSEMATDSGLESNPNSTCNSEGNEPPGIAADLIELDVNRLKPKLQEKLLKSPAKIPSTTQGGMDPHGCYLLNITELQVQPATKEKFKPYQTTISNVHDPKKEKNRKQGKHWEVTAATPPPIQSNGVQMISLVDSVETQTKYLVKLKTLQEQQAAERLTIRLERAKARQMDITTDDLQKPSFTNYREPSKNKKSNSIPTYSIEGNQQKFMNEDETYDLDEKPEGGGISYTIFE